MSEAQTPAAVKPTLAQAFELIEALSARVALLEAAAAPKPTATAREMSDADAQRILTGDLKDMKHKDAASTLGLSYGQVYSCRLEFTFKHIHKAMKAAGQINTWVK